jgi:hypothetical protein
MATGCTTGRVSFENAACVDADLLIYVGKACPIAHQTSSFGKLTRKMFAGTA